MNQRISVHHFQRAGKGKHVLFAAAKRQTKFQCQCTAQAFASCKQAVPHRFGHDILRLFRKILLQCIFCQNSVLRQTLFKAFHPHLLLPPFVVGFALVFEN